MLANSEYSSRRSEETAVGLLLIRKGAAPAPNYSPPITSGSSPPFHFLTAVRTDGRHGPERAFNGIRAGIAGSARWIIVLAAVFILLLFQGRLIDA